MSLKLFVQFQRPTQCVWLESQHRLNGWRFYWIEQCVYRAFQYRDEFLLIDTEAFEIRNQMAS
jgi:hypothetical protein